MPINTGWVDPPPSIGGLDHLGTQQPCIWVYSQLLPGITNVTDRARYYSFYPWLIWSMCTRFPKVDYPSFVERFRRADCLFTLIAERHSRETDRNDERHGGAMVGRMKLTAALSALEDGLPLRLDHYVDQNSDTRYFKNPMGGLGQYYAGILTDLAILDSRSSKWIGYSHERGRPIAESFEKFVDSDLFWQTCENDRVSVKSLDRLATFCPCHLTKSVAEHRHLQALFFAEEPYVEADDLQRRSSLGVILHLTSALQKSCQDQDLTRDVFRGCVYTGHLPCGTIWSLPPALEKTRALWAIYERGDLFSVAVQGVFAACLAAMDQAGRSFASIEEFSSHFIASDFVKASIEKLGPMTFAKTVELFNRNGPLLCNWQSLGHEVELAYRIRQTSTADFASSPDLITCSMSCLTAIAARDLSDSWNYGAVGWTDEILMDYPLNLLSFRQRFDEWGDRKLLDVFSDIVNWALGTHLRVALRKLRQTGQSSFRFRPAEQGLEVVEIPPPGSTVPRFNQVMQILRDIGMLRKVNEITQLTAAGRRQLEVVCG